MCWSTSVLNSQSPDVLFVLEQPSGTPVRKMFNSDIKKIENLCFFSHNPLDFQNAEYRSTLVGRTCRTQAV